MDKFKAWYIFGTLIVLIQLIEMSVQFTIQPTGNLRSFARHDKYARWEAFKLQYKKKYPNPVEELMRRELFFKALNIVDHYNAEYGEDMAKLNRFSDWTETELRNRFGGGDNTTESKSVESSFDELWAKTKNETKMKFLNGAEEQEHKTRFLLITKFHDMIDGVKWEKVKGGYKMISIHNEETRTLANRYSDNTTTLDDITIPFTGSTESNNRSWSNVHL